MVCLSVQYISVGKHFPAHGTLGVDNCAEHQRGIHTQCCTIKKKAIRVLCRMAVGTFRTTLCSIMMSVNLKHGCSVFSIEKQGDKMETVDLRVAAVPTQSLSMLWL